MNLIKSLSEDGDDDVEVTSIAFSHDDNYLYIGVAEEQVLYMFDITTNDVFIHCPGSKPSIEMLNLKTVRDDDNYYSTSTTITSAATSSISTTSLPSCMVAILDMTTMLPIDCRPDTDYKMMNSITPHPHNSALVLFDYGHEYVALARIELLQVEGTGSRVNLAVNDNDNDNEVKEEVAGGGGGSRVG